MIERKTKDKTNERIKGRGEKNMRIKRSSGERKSLRERTKKERVKIKIFFPPHSNFLRSVLDRTDLFFSRREESDRARENSVAFDVFPGPREPGKFSPRNISPKRKIDREKVLGKKALFINSLRGSKSVFTGKVWHW